MLSLQLQSPKWTPFGITLQQIFPEKVQLSPSLQALQRYWQEEHVAEEYFFQALEMVNWAGDEMRSDHQTALVALVLYSQQSHRQGSTCLSMSSALPHLCEILQHVGCDTSLCAIDHLQRLFTPEQTPSLIGNFDEFRPLVFNEDRSLLYHQKNLLFEQMLVHFLNKRLQLKIEMPALSEIQKAFTEVLTQFPIIVGNRPLRLSEEQILAVLLSLTAPLTIISGGPGTGKTSVVTTILRLLKRVGLADNIALTAPTGRAARRMADSLEQGLRQVKNGAIHSADHSLITNLPESQTLHRLLRYRPSSHSFQHHEKNPLPYDVIIVDEASMIDLELMTHLLKASSSVLPYQPAPLRLLLLGDPHQLPSVGAGAILSELIPQQRSLTSSQKNVIQGIAPELTSLLDAYSIQSDSEVRETIIHLTKNYRQPLDNLAENPILRTAKAINQFTPRSKRPFSPIDSWKMTKLTSLTAVPYEHVMFLEQENSSSQLKALIEHWITQFLEDAQLLEKVSRCYDLNQLETYHDDFQWLFDYYSRFRMLTLTRVLPTGSETLNHVFRQKLSDRFQAERFFPSSYYAGAPVMIMENDYQNHLYNGDQGVFLKVKNPKSGKIELKAIFLIEGQYSTFYDHQLKRKELSYAITVHKSQGSEYEHIALVLPGREDQETGSQNAIALSNIGNLLSKEIVYTAVTRAKKSVFILGKQEVFMQAISQKTSRFSGIRSRRSQKPQSPNSSNIGGDRP